MALQCVLYRMLTVKLNSIEQKMRDIRSAFFVTHSQSVYLHTIRNPTAVFR